MGFRGEWKRAWKLLHYTRVHIGFYSGSIGILEKNMEATMKFLVGNRLHRDVFLINRDFIGVYSSYLGIL